MTGKKSMKIGSKIILQTLVVLSLILIGTFVYIIFSTMNLSKNAEEQNIATLSQKNALMTQNLLESHLNTARSLATALKGYEGVDAATRRSFFNSVMKSMIQNDKSILGVWTCWEPNAFDGLDASNINKEGSDATGRFVPYWVWVDGAVQLVPCADYDKQGAGDYYQLAKTSGKETILEPYQYEISGKKVLMTTLAVPIKDGNGKVLGVAGVDITLEALQQTQFDKGPYAASYSFLLSNSGMVVIHPKADYIDTAFQSIPGQKDTDAILAAVKTGKTYSLDDKSVLDGKLSLITYSPVKIGDTGTYWSSALVTNYSDINAASDQMTASLVVILIAVLAAIALALFLLIRSLVTKPIKSTMEFAKALASGSLDSSIEIKTMDEVGLLANTLDKDVRKAFKDIEKGRVVAEKQSRYQAAEVDKLVVNLDKIARGDMNCSFDVAPCDDDTAALHTLYTTIAGNLKVSVGAIKDLAADMNMLSQSAIEGHLATRADAVKHQGDFKKIVDGVNSTLDAVIEPISEASAVLRELSQGNLGLLVEGNYKGDHAAIKNALNDTIHTLRGYIGDIAQTLSSIAQGNLDVGITTEYRGEFVQIKDSINSIVDALNDMFAEIGAAADQVAAGTHQVADGAQALAQGATEQASAVEQLTASLAEIGSQTKQNASSANQASSIVLTVKTDANDGNTRMLELQRSMAEINDASSSISKIIKVIDDIAFQTNLLALNAAVEAARAGQYGKGFAVVAEEVRNLASRSAGAAKESSAMIQGSIDKIIAGTRLADESAHALVKIVNGVDNAAGLVGSIAIASNNQASAVSQVNTGIGQVSQVTQTNSATAEESAAASEELTGQAALLKDLVGRFHLKGQSQPGNRRVLAPSSVARPAQESRATASKPRISLNDRDFGKY